jgi:hypothetical protein
MSKCASPDISTAPPQRSSRAKWSLFELPYRVCPLLRRCRRRPFESSSHRTHSIELSNWMAMRDVAAMMRRWTFHATHPRHFGLFVAAVVRRGGACENRLPPALGGAGAASVGSPPSCPVRRSSEARRAYQSSRHPHVNQSAEADRRQQRRSSRSDNMNDRKDKARIAGVLYLALWNNIRDRNEHPFSVHCQRRRCCYSR